MATYTRTTSVDASPSADTVKQAVLDVDTDLTGIVTAYNTHDTATTGVHGLGSGTVCGTTNTQTLTLKTLSAPTLTGTVTASGATLDSPTITNATINASTISGSTLTGTITCTGATLTAGTSVNMTIQTPTLTGTVTATGATISSPAITGGSMNNTPINETLATTIRGTNKEIFKTASADSPLTALECSGTVVSNYGMTDADCVIDLPTAAEGLSFVCVLPAVRAKYFRLKCPTAQADKIYLRGVAGSDDGYIGVASGYATGTAISLFTFKASDGGYDWFAIPIFGSWVAG